jgi:hypothetical protein
VLERGDRVPVSHQQRRVDEHLEAAVDRGRVDDGVIAGDDPGRLQRPDPAQARRRAEAHALGQVGVREPPVRL